MSLRYRARSVSPRARPNLSEASTVRKKAFPRSLNANRTVFTEICVTFADTSCFVLVVESENSSTSRPVPCGAWSETASRRNSATEAWEGGAAARGSDFTNQSGEGVVSHSQSMRSKSLLQKVNLHFHLQGSEFFRVYTQLLQSEMD